MNYNSFKEQLIKFKVFSLTDIRKLFPEFDSRRLIEWQEKGYIKRIINRWYIFVVVPSENGLLQWTANRIYQPSYISLEAGLSHYGLIPEAVYTMTSISTLKTKSFDTHLCTFSYRNLKPSLFFGYKVIEWQGFPIKIAEPEKVLLDYLYLNPQLKQDEDWQGLRINLEILHEVVDTQKIQEYLHLFQTKALDKRVSRFLTYVEQC